MRLCWHRPKCTAASEAARRSGPARLHGDTDTHETRGVRTESITTVMTTDLVSIDRDQPLSDAYHSLRGAPYHHIPVLEGDRPVGMLSSTDVLKLV